MEINKHDNELTVTSDDNSLIVDLEKQSSFTSGEKRQQSYNKQNHDNDINDSSSLQKVHSSESFFIMVVYFIFTLQKMLIIVDISFFFHSVG